MVGLPLTLSITLLVGLFFFFQRKLFSFLQNSIVYMVITIVSTNVFTILSLNLSWIKATGNPLLFPTFLLYRDMIIPLLVLIYINAVRGTQLVKSKVVYFLLLFFCLIGMEELLLRYDVVHHIKWKLYYSAIINVGYLVLGLWLGKLILYIEKRSPNHESRL